MGTTTLESLRELPVSMDDVMEVPLILSRQQIDLLTQAAERNGMTSAQYLRRCITAICSNQMDS